MHIKMRIRRPTHTSARENHWERVLTTAWHKYLDRRDNRWEQSLGPVFGLDIPGNKKSAGVIHASGSGKVRRACLRRACLGMEREYDPRYPKSWWPLEGMERIVQLFQWFRKRYTRGKDPGKSLVERGPRFTPTQKGKNKGQLTKPKWDMPLSGHFFL